MASYKHDIVVFIGRFRPWHETHHKILAKAAKVFGEQLLAVDRGQCERLGRCIYGDQRDVAQQWGVRDSRRG